MDFSTILDGLLTGTAVGAVISAGALIALFGFAKWATRKVATFFDGVEDRAYFAASEREDQQGIDAANAAINRMDMADAINDARSRR
jgi:hypothetical protein